MDRETSRNRIFSEDTILKQSVTGYRFTSDSMLLSWFTALNAPATCSRALEIGSGTGVVPIVLKRRGFRASIDCVEIQKSLFELLEENIRENLLSDSLTPILADFSDFCGWKHAKYDLVFTNPPYHRQTNGRVAEDSEKAVAKHEICGSLDSFLESAAKILRVEGHFMLVYPLERLQYALSSAAKHGYHLKSIIFFRETVKSSPSTFTADFVFNPKKENSYAAQSNIVTLRAENGEYSETGEEIMHENRGEN